jgi:hypothetical protein
MTAIALSHPLASTVEGITAINEYLNVQLAPPVGDGWVTVEELIADRSPLREELLARIRRRYHTDDRHFVAMTFFGATIWQVVVASIASYLTARRVPQLNPANVMLRWDADGWADTVAIVNARFAALPDDPAADHVDVTIVADRDALRARLVEYIVSDYVPALIDVTSATSPLGKHALWSVVADRCVGTIVWLAPQLNLTATCGTEVRALLQAWPRKTRTNILAVEHAGRQELFLERSSCCLSYKVPEHGYCSTCPLVSREERVHRLRKYMANQTPA